MYVMYVWYGMVWYGMVWYGMVWYGMVWYGMVWYGMVWYGMYVCMYINICTCVCLYVHVHVKYKYKTMQKKLIVRVFLCVYICMVVPCSLYGRRRVSRNSWTHNIYPYPWQKLSLRYG